MHLTRGRYVKVVQLITPHVLRYLAVAAVLTQNRTKDVTKVQKALVLHV